MFSNIWDISINEDSRASASKLIARVSEGVRQSLSYQGVI